MGPEGTWVPKPEGLAGGKKADQALRSVAFRPLGDAGSGGEGGGWNPGAKRAAGGRERVAGGSGWLGIDRAGVCGARWHPSEAWGSPVTPAALLHKQTCSSLPPRLPRRPVFPRPFIAASLPLPPQCRPLLAWTDAVFNPITHTGAGAHWGKWAHSARGSFQNSVRIRSLAYFVTGRKPSLQDYLQILTQALEMGCHPTSPP